MQPRDNYFLLLLVAFVLFDLASASTFFPYGAAEGDVLGATCDDCCLEVYDITSFPMKYFGTSWNNLTVSNNGVISPNGCVEAYSPIAFPTSNCVIAAYWGDVDTSNGGSVWQQMHASSSPIDNAVSTANAPFTASHWVQVTWEDVPYYGGSNRLNNFQLVLAWDSSATWSCFLYGDEGPEGGLDWTTGNASDGSDGLGGIPAQVGFDAGDGVHYYTHPDSRTDRIRGIDGITSGEPATLQSNVNGIPGQFCFEVSGACGDGIQSDIEACDYTGTRITDTGCTATCVNCVTEDLTNCPTPTTTPTPTPTPTPSPVPPSPSRDRMPTIRKVVFGK